MRPIVNIEELKMGAAMTEQPTKQKMAGAEVDVICRDCWITLLNNRSKEEIIEILETICGLMMEVDNRMKVDSERMPAGGDFIIEKLNQQGAQPFSGAFQPAIWQGTPNIQLWEEIKPFCSDNSTGKFNLTERFSQWVTDIQAGTMTLNSKDED
jgi:hypothetical protein